MILPIKLPNPALVSVCFASLGIRLLASPEGLRFCCVKDGMPALLQWSALLGMRQRSLPMFYLCSNLLGIDR